METVEVKVCVFARCQNNHIKTAPLKSFVIRVRIYFRSSEESESLPVMQCDAEGS